MSNNDLYCKRCRGRHHPAACPLDMPIISKTKTFVEYLKKKRLNSDRMGEDFREWINDLNVDEWIAFGENYADEREGANQ